MSVALLIGDKIMNHQFIKKIETFQVGGGANMDFITLANGQVLGIDNDNICLYDNLDDFYEGREGTWDHVKTIEWGNDNG
jgi:hypothetical protein